MNKVWNFLKTFVLGFAEKPLLDEGGKFIDQALEKFYAKNPKACTALVSSLYVWIEAVVEDLVSKTTNTYDDDAVKEIKQELEAFASRHSFTLTNLGQG